MEPARSDTTTAPAPQNPGARRSLVFRRLADADRGLIVEHLRTLDTLDRVQRFHTPLDDDGIAAYATRLDMERTLVIGAIDALTGVLVGLVEVHDVADRVGDAPEAAISVAAGRRGEGIARRLLLTATSDAFRRGAPCVTFNFRPDNEALVKTIRAVGAITDRAGGYGVIMNGGGAA